MNTPKQDCELLMRDVLPFAKRMLAEHGEFYPYGGMMRASGEIVHVGAQEEGTDMPLSHTLIDLLRKHFADEAAANAIIASCLILDVRIRRPGTETVTDAIKVNLDHSAGYSAEVLFPYRLDSDTLALDEPFAQAGDASIFKKLPTQPSD